MKIAVYAISLNEEKFIKRCIDSAADADYFILADTGSTDRTKDIAEECGAQVHDILIKPWRFDHARSVALALVPDVDICIALDIDEVLNEGWRAEVESLWKKNTTRMRYKFDWGSGIVFYSDKIHSRKGYYWKHPCHELLTPDGRIFEQWVSTDKLLISHYPDETKSRGQYMDLLTLATQEDPVCPRNAFYYARELTFTQQWGKAIVALERYLAMPAASWAHERCYAMRLIGDSFAALNDTPSALYWYRKACAEAPHLREGWTALAFQCMKLQLWSECYSAITYALSITERELVYTSDPKCWTGFPYDIASVAAWNLGLKEKAILYIDTALSYCPDDQRLLANAKLMRGQ
jgi:glycosyltransferase involved in cell wall biosynthesis